MYSSFTRKAFTLIELLVVIAIIAILAVVVVLTLNPAEMLRQARDANRLSDLATINSAINLYVTDQSGSSGFFLGNASSVYLSLPDTSSSCSNLGLATTSPSSYAYACANSTSSRNINASGWIPLNLSLISSGSPLGSLPIDPTNQSSTGLYYTYYTNSSQFEITSLFESQKNKSQYGQKPIIQNLPEVNAQGSSLTINPLFNPTGLGGYWPMDEGSGSSTLDLSGNSNLGAWAGTAAGTNSTYYTTGKVGSWAGTFDGNTDKVTIASSSFVRPNSTYSVSLWFQCASSGSHGNLFNMSATSSERNTIDMNGCSSSGYLLVGTFNGTFQTVTSNASTLGWNFVVLVVNSGSVSAYLNGSQISGSGSPSYLTGTTNAIGYNENGGYFSGLIDDVRIYNRALSVAEIQALYNAEK
jgi:prepilin-type N-terminal cleavage/methylation domain-containing protein